MSASKDKQTTIPFEKQSPKWYFIIQGQLISIRADNRVQAFRRARVLVGLT